MIGICEDLRKSVLQAAIQGRLTQQLPEDGDTETLYQDIQKEKQRLIKEGRIKKEKPLPEITEDDIPFDIPENWKWVHLCDVGYTQTGNTPPTKSPEYYGNDIPFIGPGDIMLNGTINYSHNALSFLGKEVARIAVEGTILQVCIGGSIGKSAITLKDIAFNQQINSITPILCCSSYLYAVIDSSYFKSMLIDNSGGTATPIINRGFWDKMPFPLPPLAEQKRIVARVDELMARIDEMEKTEKDITALYDAFPGDMKAALLQAAIQGKLTEQLASDGDAETLYADIQKEKQRLIKEGKIKKEKPLPEITEDDIPFDIPEKWKWVYLNDIVVKQIKRGKSPHYANMSNTLVFAQKCNTKAGFIDTGLAQYLDETYLENYPASEFMKDFDVVINSTGGGTLGRVGIYRDSDNPRKLPIVPDSHVTVLRSMDSTIQQYLYHVMKFMQPELEMMGSGSTNQTELRPDTVKALCIPLPPLAEQKRIVEKLDKLLPLCDAMNAEIAGGESA